MLNDFKTEGKFHAPAPVTLNQVRSKVTKAHVPNKYWASPFHDIYNQSTSQLKGPINIWLFFKEKKKG